MNALLIEETKGTPRITLNLNGELLIEGRSLPEDPILFYAPVLNWVTICNIVHATVHIRLDYMNTSSTKELYLFFKYLKGNQHVKDITVNWYYEEGDDDVYEIGREFEAMVELSFCFHTFAEAME